MGFKTLDEQIIDLLDHRQMVHSYDDFLLNFVNVCKLYLSNNVKHLNIPERSLVVRKFSVSYSKRQMFI